ncbi:aminotransferase class V-fold PLP-dependent enzyme [Lawsonia intracellularis]|uniref:Kynureninase n=1 Tax=Lawsonia intracellularis (strain PHE/MN1-00) TaxID=363253 RepID=Q1MRA6_LAWIP|nr:aminotransferase class V-fold PLP-dependent enzyme [Lawsonia intracellularis]AGC49832.1 kynureninase [Lawsonia intracellularis N343]KAA0205336.1 aminotransferase class V-fold PLP-dependent enzyme [Lawsonia intracellularis]MBZ3892130.1 aminotransferase class V-fold PLP-dependent enzyme [Lawsonia intracellularis]OMQ04598.1 kyurenine hydrolase [Lawsonia intracellularis]RBN32117.1 aminotransferase class V-fold PLP-dependent enzyme [Lawsonia intracellularis]
MLVDKFILPECKVYMCGHSLGPSLKTTSDAVCSTLQDFASYGVSSWNKSGWIDLSYALGAKIAALVGAKFDEVIVCDSTVLNLFKALKVAMSLQNGRNIILTTDDNFPADLYIAQGISEVKYIKSNEIYKNIDETVAVLMLTHVNYRDSSVLDMKTINEYAHKYGVLTVWDLSHSIGIVPVDLEESSTDFAVGCTYKYLSGGPGSPAFIYANRMYHEHMQSPIQGWIGHNQPFSFEKEYTSFGVRKFMSGTPAILSMKALEAALEIFDKEVIVKSYSIAKEYSNILIKSLKSHGIEVYAPQNRGGHVAFMHKHGYAFSRALIDAGFICDYRAPDLIRLCVNPLYISLRNIESCIEQIQFIMERSLYLKPEYNQMQKVT